MTKRQRKQAWVTAIVEVMDEVRVRKNPGIRISERAMSTVQDMKSVAKKWKETFCRASDAELHLMVEKLKAS